MLNSSGKSDRHKTVIFDGIYQMLECKALMVSRGEDKSIKHQIETIKIDVAS